MFDNEDVSNRVLNSDVFKVMASSDGENSSTIIVNQSPVEIMTRGKPVMIVTIATASPKNELLRRFPSVNLTTTAAQTVLILKRKAEYHERGIQPTYEAKVLKALRCLRRVRVRVPFASKLVNVLDPHHVIIRTHFDRFIDYIKFATTIHQYNREEDADGYLLAEQRDYELAREAMLATTSNAYSIPLTKNQQRILAILEKVKVAVSVPDLEPQVTFVSDRTLYRELDRLAEWGFLEKDKEVRERSDKPVMVYRYVRVARINLPLWDDLDKSFLSDASDSSNGSIMSNGSNGGAFEANEGFAINIVGLEHINYTKIEETGVCSACSKPNRNLQWRDADGREYCEVCRPEGSQVINLLAQKQHLDWLATRGAFSIVPSVRLIGRSPAGATPTTSPGSCSVPCSSMR